MDPFFKGHGDSRYVWRIERDSWAPRQLVELSYKRRFQPELQLGAAHGASGKDSARLGVDGVDGFEDEPGLPRGRFTFPGNTGGFLPLGPPDLQI